MQDLHSVQTLIDLAAKNCKSKKALADELGVMPQHLSQWASGRRKCMPDDQAALATIAGVNAVETLQRATLEANEGSKKYEVLARGLGKGFLATGAAVASAGANAMTFDFIRCIERLNRQEHFHRLTVTTKAHFRAFFWRALLQFR